MSRKPEGCGFIYPGDNKGTEEPYSIFTYEETFCAVAASGLEEQEWGKYSSQAVIQYFSECKMDERYSTADKIQNYFQETTDELSKCHTGQDGQKTAVAWLCIHEDRAVWGHTGDSRIYHFWNEEPYTPTTSHNFTLENPRKKSGSPGLHTPIHLEEGRHVFLLCTDGFWKMLDEEEMVLDLYKSISAWEWLYCLCGRALQRQETNHRPYSAVSVYTEQQEKTKDESLEKLGE